jgi:hypothetical protein
MGHLSPWRLPDSHVGHTPGQLKHLLRRRYFPHCAIMYGPAMRLPLLVAVIWLC